MRWRCTPITGPSVPRSPWPRLRRCAAPPPDEGSPFALRPLWLVAEPRPLGTDPAATQLQLLSGPERIETGWWDGGDIGRDYFVGRGTQGEELWLYRDRGGQWFVHGVFA